MMERIQEGRSAVWVHRFAVLTACCTFLLVIAGGLVTSTDSGLAVPDWPLSYGQLMPPMVGGIFYEHAHRMVATFVGFLTTILAILLWRNEERIWVRNLGIVAWFAVVIQGVLGGLTVLFLLPTPISVSHATLAQCFFSLTVFLALVTSPSWRTSDQVLAEAAVKTRRLSCASGILVLAQLILGALMRHTGSGLAIPDFPLSYGAIWPPLSESSLPAMNLVRADMDLPPVAIDQIFIHLLHRVGAVAVAFVLITLVIHVFRTYRASYLREPALFLLMMMAVQILLGALTVWTTRNIQVATSHVAAGALLLAGNVVLCARVFRYVRKPEVENIDILKAEASPA